MFRTIDSAKQFALELNMGSVCDIIFREIEKFFFVQKCVLLFWDSASQKLQAKHFYGLSPDEQKNAKNTCLGIGESISGLVAKNKQALLVKDFKNESYYRRINKEEYFSGSFVSVPIFAKDELLGVINVINRKSGTVFITEDMHFIEGIASIASIALKNIQLNTQIQQHYVNIIITLAKTLDARDHYTKKHSENVEKISVLIAKEMGLSHSDIEYIHKAALLHDIGKIGISDSILKKASSLTQGEYRIIKEHPIRSEEIISSISFLKYSTKIIRHHHERYDGKGYPDGLKGKNIELGARIINVADSYDAMISDRTYKKAFSQEKVAKEFTKCKGAQFDPEVVEAFLRIIERKELS
ncbi:HD domain-containing phosphohydrolase [Candidatus Omnitrophota bacterium]